MKVWVSDFTTFVDCLHFFFSKGLGERRSKYAGACGACGTAGASFGVHGAHLVDSTPSVDELGAAHHHHLVIGVC